MQTPAPQVLSFARSSERGAVLVHVAIALLGLIAFTTFVADYGVMWVSRGQAQTSADAGALAGAVAMAYDSPLNLGVVKNKAIAVAQANNVFGGVPSVLQGDVTFPACPPGAPGAPDTCIKVDVYRNQERGNQLPIFFGGLVGVTGQGVKATATAQVLVGDKADCVKPFAIPDKWTEIYPTPKTWETTDEYNLTKPDNPNKGDPLLTPDLYTAPSANSNGTGYRLPEDNGLMVILKSGSPGDAIQPGWFYPVRVKPTDSGGADYEWNIANCNTRPIGPGTELEPENGNMVGPTKQGIEALIALDPTAHFDVNTKTIVGGCMAAGTCTKSPRLGAIAAFDPYSYSQTRTNGNTTVTVTHILGFWIESITNNGDVVGYFTYYPALATGSSSLTASASFLRTIILVR